MAELACVRKRRAIGGVHGEGCVLGVARIVHLEHVHGVDSRSTRRQQDVWVVQVSRLVIDESCCVAWELRAFTLSRPSDATCWPL
eukprot:scaffold1268_cov333-Pinguiococcus_pyrenoidosus.AAC.2